MLPNQTTRKKWCKTSDIDIPQIKMSHLGPTHYQYHCLPATSEKGFSCVNAKGQFAQQKQTGVPSLSPAVAWFGFGLFITGFPQTALVTHVYIYVYMWACTLIYLRALVHLHVHLHTHRVGTLHIMHPCLPLMKPNQTSSRSLEGLACHLFCFHMSCQTTAEYKKEAVTDVTGA